METKQKGWESQHWKLLTNTQSAIGGMALKKNDGKVQSAVAAVDGTIKCVTYSIDVPPLLAQRHGLVHATAGPPIFELNALGTNARVNDCGSLQNVHWPFFFLLLK